MVIVSNICNVAFTSHSPFSTKCKKLYLPGSTDVKTCVYSRLEYHMLPATQNSHGFLTTLKLFA